MSDLDDRLTTISEFEQKEMNFGIGFDYLRIRHPTKIWGVISENP